MDNLKEVFVIILSSTVLSGIITSLVSFIINGRNNRLKYITEDRRNWRKEIRAIVDEIYTVKYPHQIKSVFAKLKVRLNPYGKGKKADYIHDSHIWELVAKIEENPNKNLEKNKEQLVFFLSLLLKYDWDRAKREVNGNIQSVILFIALAYGMFFLSYNHFIRCGFMFNELFIITFFVFLLLPIIISMLTCDDVIKSIKNKVKSQDKIWSKIKELIKFGVTIVVYVLSIVATVIYIFESYNISIYYLTSSSAYPEVFSVVAVMTVAWIVTTNSMSDNLAKKYTDYIQEIVLDIENKVY